MATFLDRDPYIRLWRPTYRLIGPWIRTCKSLIRPPTAIPQDFGNRLLMLEEAHRETRTLLEQLLITILSERHNRHSIEDMQDVVTTALSRHSAEVAAANAAQWAAIERLILALMSNSDQARADINDHPIARPPSVSSVDKVT